jgi:transmembrane 9 superfamily protein 3
MRRALVLAALATAILADESTHRYADGEPIKLWANKIGPYHNPQETYNYFALPFCSDDDLSKVEHKWGGLGEVLEGNDLVNSGLDMSFKTDRLEPVTLCSITLDADKVATFEYAIRNHYWYQFYLDDLPIWGMVGEVAGDEADETAEGSAAPSGGSGEPLMYTHRRLSLSHNGDRIIQVNLTSENPASLAPGNEISFTYTVEWKPTEIRFGKRFERYLDYDFFEHQIHWFSIFNSFMMVLFLVGIVSLILMRTLRRDYARYTHDADGDDLDADIDESGWKQVHGDVFRTPTQPMLFAALVGTGAQLASLSLLAILTAMLLTLYTGRGAVVTTCITCYLITCLVGGYVSGSLYMQLSGRQWTRVLLYTASLFPVAVIATMAVLNVVAMAYRSMSAIPFTTIVVMLLLWLLVAVPLTVAGTILGRNFGGQAEYPCRVNAIPRLVPEKAWFARPPVLMLLGGVLPFGSIFIEMYFIFTSFWNYKFYYVYGFLLLVFAILSVVTVCVTIVVTYFLLNNEDYRWAWTSFLSGASTSLYVLAYSVYYYLLKTKMSGFFQTTFYFGYMALFCGALSLMCGAIGYLGCAAFVKRIYRNIKSD